MITNKCKIQPTIGMLPSSYKISMTYEEQLLYFCNIMENEIIPNISLNSESIKDLKNYVDNYFNNLDIQEEINNKLDEMADSGELVDIIAQYLQLAGILAYNVLTDLINAENLIDGSIAKTLGLNNYLDGKGEFYKIRTLLNTDVIDGVNIIALTNFPTLIAELIPDYYRQTIQNDIEDINTEINEIKNNYDKTKTEMVVFGDSWSDSINVAEAIWPSIVSENLNLNVHNYASNGAGFVDTYTIYISDEIDTFEADDTFDKDLVKYVVFMGGINDFNKGVTAGNLATGIADAMNRVKTLCPQAEILYVSNASYPYTISKSSYWNMVHNYLTTKASFVKHLNLDGITSVDLYNNTKYHLTTDGQTWLSNNIINILTGGELTIYPTITTYSNNDISIKHSFIRNNNTIIINYDITFLTSNSVYTLTATDLNYYDSDLIGTIISLFNRLVLQPSENQVVVAIDNSVNINSKAKLTIAIPLNVSI